MYCCEDRQDSVLTTLYIYTTPYANGRCYGIATISRLLKMIRLFCKTPYKREYILQKRPIKEPIFRPRQRIGVSKFSKNCFLLVKYSAFRGEVTFEYVHPFLTRMPENVLLTDSQKKALYLSNTAHFLARWLSSISTDRLHELQRMFPWQILKSQLHSRGIEHIYYSEANVCVWVFLRNFTSLTNSQKSAT